MTTLYMTTLDGWVYDDGCVICPVCNEFITCDPLVTEIIAAIPNHTCAA